MRAAGRARAGRKGRENARAESKVAQPLRPPRSGDQSGFAEAVGAHAGLLGAGPTVAAHRPLARRSAAHHMLPCPFSLPMLQCNATRAKEEDAQCTMSAGE